MTFVPKQLTVTISLASGSFSGTTNQNTITLTGYRMSAHIVNAGGFAQCELDLRIYGLNLSVMNQLSTLGKSPVVLDNRNIITVSAGDVGGASTLIYTGSILQAYTDLSGAPDSIFHISALSGLSSQLQNFTGISTPSYSNVATTMQTLANNLGLTLENNGVNVQVPSFTLQGSGLQQVQQLAGMANINYLVDETTLAIWPKGGSRTSLGSSVLTITPQNGLIGYPYPSGQGMLAFKCYFSPLLKFGAAFTLAGSIITPANGPWTICHADWDLECYLFDGKWEGNLEAYPPGFVGSQMAG